MASSVAIAALAAIVAIIAAGFTAPASAQSEEATGRIVARLLDDGRVEFGWQPAGGERVLPRARYFPAGADVGRWLNSSSVEVGGAEIGRINARLKDDGRIEFAFTPTDGERILPPSRYFPADARVRRWLRSTEITIGPPKDDAASIGYAAVSAGYRVSCAIRASSGAIECWGSNEHGQTDAPPGRFIAVSAGAWHTCAIRASSGEITCWGITEGDHYFGQTDAPEGSFTAVSADSVHTCAIHTSSGAIECWGSNEHGQTDAPEGSYTAVSAGAWLTCGLRTNGESECWGYTPIAVSHRVRPSRSDGEF